MTAYNIRTIAVSWLAVLLVLSLIGCGTKNVGVIEADQLNDQRAGSGVSLAGFEVIRYNTDGFTDPSLNGTLDLSLDRKGDETRLVIGVKDAEYTTAVALEIKYDPARLHTERAEFHGLLGDDNQVLNGSFLEKAGVAGLAEAALWDNKPAALDGRFATLVFAGGASHNVSAAGDVHSNPAGVNTTFETAQSGGTQNLFGESDVAGHTASVYWTAAWHTGDGDQNSETNAADLVPLGANFQATPATDWSTAPADYDENGEVNTADLVRIASFFQERTNGYRVEAADDDGTGRADVAVLGWVTDMLPPMTPSVQGDLRTAFSYWQVDFDAASVFTYDALVALDLDGDGDVTIYVTPVTLDGTTVLQSGAESSVTVEVEEEVIVNPESLVVTGYDITVTGAEGGGGDGTLFDENLTTGTIDANMPVDFRLNSIWGTYDGVDFDSVTFPTVGIGEDAHTMTQEQYDTAFNAVRDGLVWTFGHAGADGFRRTGDWVTLDSAATSPVTGDPETGTAFPDDDPESVGGEAEATMGTQLNAGGQGVYPWDPEGLQVSVLTPVSYNFTFDILSDEAAPVLLDYSVTELLLVVQTQVSIGFQWGSGGEPADLSTSQLDLIPIGADGMPSGSIINLDYADPAAGDPLAGQFTFRLTGEPYLVLANTPGAQLSAGTDYVFRLNVDDVYSSINKPSDMLPTAPQPQGQELVTIPEIVEKEMAYAQVFYEDPKIRRNGTITFNEIQGTADPEDPEAYADILKINGDDFPISIDVATSTKYPVVAVVETGDPSVIINPDGPNKIPGTRVLDNGFETGRLVLDIQPTTVGITPGSGDKTFSYKLFSQDNSIVGYGTYTVPDLPLPYGDVIGIDWGINVWNREEIEIGDQQYETRLVSYGTAGTVTPDILWIEFVDGWVFEPFHDPGALNVRAIIEDDEHPAGEYNMDLQLRVVGIGAAGNIIAIHEFVAEDYFDPLNPAGGIMKVGGSYKVMLKDGKHPTGGTTFTEIMHVGS